METTKKKEELLLYLVFGVTTTAVNILSFQLLYNYGLDYKWANLVALLIGKGYAYITNKIFVFKSHCNNWKDLLKEFFRFVCARGITGLIDCFGMIIAVEVFGVSAILTKYVIQVVVIVLNYVFSKWAVFKQSK